MLFVYRSSCEWDALIILGYTEELKDDCIAEHTYQTLVVLVFVPLKLFPTGIQSFFSA